MSSDQEILSHEEIWDDSALIDSWNEALAEYKKYHSVFVTGGSVRDLPQAPDSTLTQSETLDTEVKDAQSSRIESAEQETTAATTSVAPPPQALLGSIRDEGLKKLLMSWYYAGYYTGLFEGQQRQDQGPS
ncbi:hypothetical protein E4U42_006215 [Claviceps africana]|uniref:Survival Motor Neuron Gemin2-binding domain-containing protein n=1 Tax=Claviceps africana TaxID=83212 RepID=A0A8K0J8Q1_9HYPO|nr:hypothetical protein E4U42_006215 [Claviceps africana]